MATTQSKPKSRYAQAAASIKKELSAAFPGIKFSVKSKSFSMGNSVDVSWELGPTSKEVDVILDKYTEGDFDGMTDSYNYRKNDQFRASHGSAKYVHGSRSMPDGLFDRLCRDIARHQGVLFTSQWQRRENDSFDLGSLAHQAFSRCSFPAGAEYIGVASGWELTLTGCCASGDAVRIIHSKTDEEAEMREVIRREFDRIRALEAIQRPRLTLLRNQSAVEVSA
jgi:hypothetical protein